MIRSAATTTWTRTVSSCGRIYSISPQFGNADTRPKYRLESLCHLYVDAVLKHLGADSCRRGRHTIEASVGQDTSYKSLQTKATVKHMSAGPYTRPTSKAQVQAAPALRGGRAGNLRSARFPGTCHLGSSLRLRLWSGQGQAANSTH